MPVTSPYDDMTPESIKASMLRDLEGKGAGIDIREGAYANTLVSTAAYQLWKLYQQFPGLLSMVFPDGSSGEYIDKNAEQIGMYRTPGRKAAALLHFTGVEGTVIPEGTVLYAPESGLRFWTTEEGRIEDGAADLPAEAAEAGSAYNLPAGAIRSMYVNIAGIWTVQNPEAAAGGADVESDEDFFARYHDRRTLPITSGNQAHYVLWATEVPGVAHAGCVPLWNGNGTVKVVIAGAGRKPVDETIRAACAAHIEENRPIGATVTVVSVTERAIPLTATVELLEGFTADQVADQLREAVNVLLSAQPFGETVAVPYSRFLACLLQCQGVADYTAFQVDGGTGAVTIGAGEAATVGAVNLTAG